jgi:hypothetical protein
MTMQDSHLLRKHLLGLVVQVRGQVQELMWHLTTLLLLSKLLVSLIARGELETRISHIRDTRSEILHIEDPPSKRTLL